MDLKEWIIRYLKNKDIFYKKIVEIKEGNPLIVIYKDKEQRIFIQDEVNFTEVAEVLKKSNNDDKLYIFIVCPNKKSNLDALLEHWSRITDFKHFQMFFVNTDSLTEPKWQINPHIHNKISEPEALKPGLESLFGTVQEVE